MRFLRSVLVTSKRWIANLQGEILLLWNGKLDFQTSRKKLYFKWNFALWFSKGLSNENLKNSDYSMKKDLLLLSRRIIDIRVRALVCNLNTANCNVKMRTRRHKMDIPWTSTTLAPREWIANYRCLQTLPPPHDDKHNSRNEVKLKPRTADKPHRDVRLLLDVDTRGFTWELELFLSGCGVLIGGDFLPSPHGEERPRPVMLVLNIPFSTVVDLSWGWSSFPNCNDRVHTLVFPFGRTVVEPNPPEHSLSESPPSKTCSWRPFMRGLHY